MFSPFDNVMFNAFPIIFGIIFIGVIGMFIFGIGSSIKQYASNKSKPVETLPARIIAKRPHTWGGAGDSSAHTSYYVTFELENGERIEMPVNGDFYGMNVEGDTGMLTHQGTQMISFEREII
ncbi:MAG: hypothetical protein K0S75_262 [Clostridia bacterium]|jgi:hypothetical protein|nr:hypothetical protein [Clostridia bacterium]